MIIEYTHMNGLGLTYRTRHYGVVSFADEPYPPGGMLRVMRNSKGQITGGPLISEILTWDEIPDEQENME
jgi:hypothetical protein